MTRHHNTKQGKTHRKTQLQTRQHSARHKRSSWKIEQDKRRPDNHKTITRRDQRPRCVMGEGTSKPSNQKKALEILMMTNCARFKITWIRYDDMRRKRTLEKKKTGQDKTRQNETRRDNANTRKHKSNTAQSQCVVLFRLVLTCLESFCLVFCLVLPRIKDYHVGKDEWGTKCNEEAPWGSNKPNKIVRVRIRLRLARKCEWRIGGKYKNEETEGRKM